MDPYQAVLARKERYAPAEGFATEVNEPWMFPFQNHAVQWALAGGRRALFEDTGLGKSRQQLAFADRVQRHTGGRVLILAPLAVGPQTVAEAESVGLEGVAFSRSPDTTTARIVVTNYDNLDKFDSMDVAGVVLDECFAPGTWIDLEGGRKHIEDVRVGDKIVNASGIDTVSDVHRREVPFAIRLHFNGRSVVCSPNHPWFTQRGWVGAQDLHPGDSLMESGAAMRMVRGDLHPEAQAVRGHAILRAILFSEMADASAGNPGTGALTGSGGEEGGGEAAVAGVGSPEGAGGTRTHRGDEPDGRPIGMRQDLPHVESHEALTFRTWGERAWLERAAGDDARCSWTDLGSGVCRVVGPTDSRLSDVLQTRLGPARVETRNRGGWVHAPITEGPCEGREEGRRPGFVGVDRLEVLEPGHPDMEQFRSPDGKFYFYDLGGTRHPSFSVEGVLVHNSSILKSFMGSTKLALCERFAATPFRLACTATPAPNDILEIGNHSEFLGILSSHQMIARWFINDTTEMGKYRLKGHAVGPFWDWVASWALCAGKPSDIGPFDDTRYNLPPLNLHKHVVETDIVSGAAEGSLFRMGGLSATKIHGEKRLTTTARAAKVAELIAAEPDEPWLVWCETNYEAEAVMAAVPHAVEVSGSMSSDVKAERLLGFCKGGVLLTKPKIAGLGMNWQHCARVVFAGGSYSFEAFYQAVRRCWRFGQTRPVDAHVILAFTEQALWEVVSGKADAHDSMKLAMFAASRRAQSRHSAMRDYHPTHVGRLPSWLVSTHPEPKDI